MKNTLTVILIIAIVVVGAGAFYGGMVYGKSQANGARPNFQNMTAAQRQQFAGARGANGRGGANGGGFVSGDIIAKDATSITVKTQDGSSKIVFLAGSTQISKSAAGSAADLNSGGQVVVNGTANSDGSVTATNIQIRPQMPAGQPGGNNPPTPVPGQ